VGILVVVLVGVTVGGQMVAAADRLKEKINEAFQAALQYKLKRAIKKMQQEALQQMAIRQANEALDDDEPDADGAPLVSRKEDAEVTPHDIFVALDKDGGGTVGMDEFKEFFEVLELEMTDSQKEQLFAFCDVDCSGEISEKEFEEGWEKMLAVFLEQSAEGQGLSRIQIFIAVLWIVACLALLIVFILITLSPWNNEGSFASVVQSSLISGCGKAAVSLRKKGKAESGESIDGLAKKIVDNSETAATEE